MIHFNSKYRSTQREIMDDLEFQGAEMKNLLVDLKKVNRWLGGNKITLNGLSVLLKNLPEDQEIKIIDIGCGDGEILRKCAELANRKGVEVNCIGIDFNPNIIAMAKAKSIAYSNISFQTKDVFSVEKSIPNCDIALATLFIHHFNDEKVMILLSQLIEKSRAGVVINDLHRSRIAFVLFKIVSRLFLKTATARHDGAVSIARGFKRNELKAFSDTIENHKSKITWRWAFRYQWILKKQVISKF